MLKKCKKWNRLFTSLSELQNCLMKYLELKNEPSRLKWCTCDRKVTRPKLYRQNKISHDEKLENLTFLLDGEDSKRKNANFQGKHSRLTLNKRNLYGYLAANNKSVHIVPNPKSSSLMYFWLLNIVKTIVNHLTEKRN